MKGGDVLIHINKENESIIHDFIFWSIIMAAEMDRDEKPLTKIEQTWYEKVDSVVGLIDKDIRDKALEMWREEE